MCGHGENPWNGSSLWHLMVLIQEVHLPVRETGLQLWQGTCCPPTWAVTSLLCSKHLSFRKKFVLACAALDLLLIRYCRDWN